MKHLPIRYALLLALEPIGTVRAVEDLVKSISTYVDVGERPSKFVSDLLRTEVRRGRVERVGWGQYRLVRFPRTTRQRALARTARAIRSPKTQTTETGQNNSFTNPIGGKRRRSVEPTPDSASMPDARQNTSATAPSIALNRAGSTDGLHAVHRSLSDWRRDR